jgi:hypothetical protein
MTLLYSQMQSWNRKHADVKHSDIKQQITYAGVKLLCWPNVRNWSSFMSGAVCLCSRAWIPGMNIFLSIILSRRNMRRVLTRPNTASLFQVLQIPPAATSEQYGIALILDLWVKCWEVIKSRPIQTTNPWPKTVACNVYNAYVVVSELCAWFTQDNPNCK